MEYLFRKWTPRGLSWAERKQRPALVGKPVARCRIAVRDTGRGKRVPRRMWPLLYSSTSSLSLSVCVLWRHRSVANTCSSSRAAQITWIKNSTHWSLVGSSFLPFYNYIYIYKATPVCPVMASVVSVRRPHVEGGFLSVHNCLTSCSILRLESLLPPHAVQCAPQVNT